MTSKNSAVADAGTAVYVADRPQGLVRRLLKRPAAVVCLAYLLVMVGVAVLGPIVLSGVSTQRAGDLGNALQGPSSSHPFGTDSMGRDVLDRLIVGTRVTFIGIGQALATVVVIGVPLGLVAGYFRGRADRGIMWLADLTFSMPSIVIILVVLGIFRGSMTAAMITFGVIASPSMMRVVRSTTLTVREELYISAAKVSGLTNAYIITRHVMPRVAGGAIIQAALVSASALLAQSGLAFLSLIVTAPAPSWGGMVSNGIEQMLIQPWLIWPPGVLITLTILSLGMLGDALRDAAAESWSAQARPARRSRARVVRVRRSDQEEQSVAPALLQVRGLSVVFDTPRGAQPVIENVSFSVAAGTTLGIVGESGCGKSITATSLMGLLPGQARISSGSVQFDGRELVGLPERDLHAIRGSEIGLIAQEPMISLNPSFRVGWQLAEVVQRHHGVSRSEAHDRVLELLAQVHLPRPDLAARRYPHELSGGMAQRVAIARALAGEPKLLIADEPTTALDVTVQAEILQLLRELQHERQMATIIVTHDWGVIADLADRAIVMYAGQIVEQAELGRMFEEPLHPYTRALIASNPQFSFGKDKLPTIRGQVPSLGQWPQGCHFVPRCQLADADCTTKKIELVSTSGHEVRCIHHGKLAPS